MTKPPPRRLALLVGIDRYLDLPKCDHLRGAVRDAEAMADLLERRFGFPAEGIRLLRDEEATRTAVEGAFAELAERVEAGSVVVIHWSGHGSQVASLGEEPGLDQTLVPYDRGEGVEDLRDRELVGLLAPLAEKGAAVTWIADACHSGHLFRDPEVARSRHVGPRGAQTGQTPPSRARRGLGLEGWVRRPDRQVLLAACTGDQEALERPIGGEVHGEWTFALLAVLRSSPPEATARQVVEAARARLLAAGVPQTPQLVGDRDRWMFGVEGRPPVRSISVRAVEGRRIELQGGASHGLVEGSLWRIESPGGEPGSTSVTARVVRVGATVSDALLESTTRSGGRRVRDGDQAFEAVPAYGESRLAVWIDGDVSTSLRAAIDGSPVLLPAADADGAARVRMEGKELRLHDEHGFLLSSEPVHDDAATARLVARLERRARARHGLALENREPTSRVAGRLRLVPLRQGPDGSWIPAKPEAGSATALPEYRSGDRIAFEVSHDDPTYDEELFLTILDFGVSDGVTQLFPAPGGLEVLYPGSRRLAGTLPGEGIELWWPEDGPAVDGAAGAFKLFATREPTEFDWIRTDVGLPKTTFRSGPASLAERLRMGSHGPVFRSSSADDWGTAVASIWLWREPRG